MHLLLLKERQHRLQVGKAIRHAALHAPLVQQDGHSARAPKSQWFEKLLSQHALVHMDPARATRLNVQIPSLPWAASSVLLVVEDATRYWAWEARVA